MQVEGTKVEPKSQIFAYTYGTLLASSGFYIGLQIGAFGTFFKFFIKNFPDYEEDQQRAVQENIAFMFVFGGAIASLSSIYLYDKIGRYRSLLFMLTIEICVLSGMAIDSIKALYGLRLFAGYVGGFWMVFIPLMIKEILPEKHAGYLDALFSVFTTLGTCAGTFFGYEWTVQRWRWVLLWPLAIEIPKLLAFIAFFPIESPKWILESCKCNEMLKRNYELLYSPEDAVKLGADLMKRQETLKKEKKQDFKEFFVKKYWKQIMLGIILNVLNQLSGINYFLFYINDIFEALGTPMPTPFSIGFSAVALASSISVLFAMKKHSKRLLIMIGLCTQIVAFYIMITGGTFFIVPLKLLGPYLFIIGHSYSLTGLLNDYCAKILPERVYPKGIFIQWALSCIMVKISPMLRMLVGNTRMFFAFQMYLMSGSLIFIGFSVRTEEATEEEIIKRFEKKNFLC